MFSKVKPGFAHWIVVPKDDAWGVEVHIPTHTFWRFAWGWVVMTSPQSYSTEEDALIGGAADARTLSGMLDGFEIPRRERKDEQGY